MLPYYYVLQVQIKYLLLDVLGISSFKSCVDKQTYLKQVILMILPLDTNEAIPIRILWYPKKTTVQNMFTALHLGTFSSVQISKYFLAE